MTAFYERVDTRYKIIARVEHYIIIAQKHLVREELLISSLQIKVDNLRKREQYLEVLTEINNMPPSREGSKAMSHQSLDEDIAEAIDEMTDR